MKRNIKKIIASMLTSAMALGGANIAFAVNLPAPDVAEGYTRYEAEDAELINGANVANFKLENQAGQSNDINTEGNVVGGFKSLSSAESLNYDFSNTTSVRFTVERQAEGMVTVILGYRSSQEVNMEQRCGNIPIKCNDGTVKELEVGVDPTADKPKKQVSVDVDMKVGTNTIYVAGPIKGSGWINIDYIDVANYTDTENRVEPEEKEADDMGINPPIKTIYTADPSAHVWKTDPDKLYVYPSHDRYPQQGCNRMDAFHIYSTKNMVDYTDEGEYLICNGQKIEKSAVRKAASPRGKAKGSTEYIIFPYYYSDGELKRYEEKSYKEKFPFTYAYLESYKETLDERDADKNAQWFEYGRSQALTHINQNKILMSTVITGKIRAYPLETDEIPYSGLFITVKNRPDALPLTEAMAILNSPEFLQYLEPRGINARGKSIRIIADIIADYCW